MEDTMSNAPLSIRSSGSKRSSQKLTDDIYNWDRDAFPPHAAMEREPSSSSLPRTVPQVESRNSPRPLSALSQNSNASYGAGPRSHRSTAIKMPGSVHPWDDGTVRLEPEPSGRSYTASTVQASEPGGGRESPPPLSREGSKLSGRRASATTSQLSHTTGAGGAGGRSGNPSMLGYEGMGGPGQGALGLHEEDAFQDNGQAVEGEEGEGAYRSVPAEELLKGEESSWQDPEARDADEQADGAPREHTYGQELIGEVGAPDPYGGQQRQNTQGGRKPTDPYAVKSERGSRPASAGQASSLGPSGAPSPRAGNKDGIRPSARTPSTLSHRSSPSNAGSGAGSSRRTSAVPWELQDLPPEALPWSEPPEYMSPVSSTVSVNDPGIGTPQSIPFKEHSQSSDRTFSATLSNRNKAQKSSGSRPPIEIPLLPLRDLLAGSSNRRTSSAAVGPEHPAPHTPTAPTPPPVQPSVPLPAPSPPSPQPPPQKSAPASTVFASVVEEAVPPPVSRELSRDSQTAASVAASGRSFSQKVVGQSPMVEIPNPPVADHPDGLAGYPIATPSGDPTLEPPLPGHESPRPTVSGDASRASVRPSSAVSVNSSKTPFARKSAIEWHQDFIEPLPWSARALADFKAQLKKMPILLGDPKEEPLTARMDAIFALPPELWPVLPPGALYCLEGHDPRVHFGYMQHCDFPETKVRVNTYFGKWGRQLVDYVVYWQQTPRGESSWQLVDGKQQPLPWEQRQVVAHTTSGEYQYANTRMRFRGPNSNKSDAEMVEYSDAHGIDLVDTKAAHEGAPRNSDKDREAHMIDPPRPNTWGELARRPLISNLRARAGGAYMHHINYDFSGLRTSCGRRVPAGFFFTLVPNASPKTPPVPGNTSARASSVGRSIAGGLRSNGEASSMRIRSVNGPVQALLSTFGESISSSRWGAYVGGASSLSVGITNASRPSSAGPRRPESASRLPQLASCAGPSELGAVKSAWSSVGGTTLQREGSRLMAPTSPTLVTLSSKQRWRTYDVSFSHPIHSARAQELGADMAVASGRGVRSFSDAAAVLQIAEQELRLPRAFVPGPVVVPTWDDIPRLYAEHMEAARAIMPVTELDNYGTSKLHMLIYHLQCAATLEYDRLDAKLLLLPQMARLGRKSVEIDAWLQVLIEHAVYLYDKIEITDRYRWRHAPAERPPMRRSVTFAKATALSNPTSSAWIFPDPLMSTSFASRSALNVAAQAPPPPPSAQLPAACVSHDEWVSINKIMDICRHAVLHDHWVRLRSVMTGVAALTAALPEDGSCCPSSRAGSILGAYSDACATASGEGDRWTDQQDQYSHGAVNRELLDYVKADLEAMSSPDFTPAPPAIVKMTKQRGYRGEGPLPPELVAEMPTVHRPVRCRGMDESPLPPEFQKLDLWNMQSKAEQVDVSKNGPGVPSPRDAGALRFSQVSVMRLQASKGFADTRQAEVRRSMQRARGISTFDDDDVPEYGSDVADDDAASVATTLTMSTVDGKPKRRRRPSGPIKKVEPIVPGIACQTSEMEIPPPEDLQAQEEAKARMLEEALEARRLLLTGNGGRTRDQILEDALRSAEVAIESLKPRPIGATPLSEPDSPSTYAGGSLDTLEAEWRPFGRGPEPYSRSASFAPVRPPGPPAQPQPQKGQQLRDQARTTRGGSSMEGRGPEPFGLEKLTAEPSVASEGEIVIGDVPKTNASSFGGVNIGVGGLVDYETAMARRRAIAGAEVAHDRSSFIPKSEVMNLFVTYCNLTAHPDLIEMLHKAVDAPVSSVTVSAISKAVSATSRNAISGRMDVDSEATRQRIRATAWLLGVTWRRITNETYTSFMCRVLGWPNELAGSLHRTRATQLIARALVRGHDMHSVPKPLPRH